MYKDGNFLFMPFLSTVTCQVRISQEQKWVHRRKDEEHGDFPSLNFQFPHAERWTALGRRVTAASTWGGHEGEKNTGARILQGTAVTLGEFCAFFDDIDWHFTSFEKADSTKMAKLNPSAIRRAQIQHSGPYKLWVMSDLRIEHDCV